MVGFDSPIVDEDYFFPYSRVRLDLESVIHGNSGRLLDAVSLGAVWTNGPSPRRFVSPKSPYGHCIKPGALVVFIAQREPALLAQHHVNPWPDQFKLAYVRHPPGSPTDLQQTVYLQIDHSIDGDLHATDLFGKATRKFNAGYVEETLAPQSQTLDNLVDEITAYCETPKR